MAKRNSTSPNPKALENLPGYLDENRRRIRYSCGSKRPPLHVGPFEFPEDVKRAQRIIHEKGILALYPPKDDPENFRKAVAALGYPVVGHTTGKLDRSKSFEEVAMTFYDFRLKNAFSAYERQSLGTNEQHRANVRRANHPKIDRSLHWTHLQPHKVTEEMITGWLEALLEHFAVNTVRNYYKAVSPVFLWLFETGHLPRDVMANIREPLPKEGKEAIDHAQVRIYNPTTKARMKKPINCFTPQEAPGLIERMYEVDRPKGFLYDLVWCGIRFGESVGSATPDHIELCDGDYSEFLIREGIDSKRRPTEAHTDGRKPVYRGAIIPGALATALHEWSESDEYLRRKELGREHGNARDWLLLQPNGLPYHGATWNPTKADYAAIGLSPAEVKRRRLSANSLRHAGISNLVEAGEGLTAVARQAGNSEDEIAKTYYAQSLEKVISLAKAMRRGPVPLRSAAA